MGLVEADLKDKLTFLKAKITTFVDAFSFLIEAGYSDLDAFSNALYLFPDNITDSIVQASATIDGGFYRFRLFKQNIDVLSEYPHLKEFYEHCCKHNLDTGLPKSEIEFVIRNRAIHDFLCKKFEASKTIFNVSNNDLPF